MMPNIKDRKEVTLPVDKFSSVKCDGGTLLSEGKTSIATFVAFPGLKESLDVDKLDLDINLSNNHKRSCFYN